MQIYFNEDAAPLYAVIYSRGTPGQVWDPTATAMATYAAIDHADYKIALTYNGGDSYSLAIPTDLPSGAYDILIYYQLGGTAAVNDTHIQTRSHAVGSEVYDHWGGVGMNLTEARLILRDSVLHTGGSSYDPEKLDRAILAAGNRFVRETNCNSAFATVTFGDNEWVKAAAADLLLTGWIEDQFMAAFQATTFRPLKLVPHRSILRRKAADDTSSATASLIAFPDSSRISIYPKSSGNQSIDIKRRIPFVSFEPGTATPDDVTINIPSEWIHQFLWTGCRFYLLGGAPGHPDAATAGKDFDELIESAKMHFADNRPGTDDRDVHPGIARGVR